MTSSAKKIARLAEKSKTRTPRGIRMRGGSVFPTVIIVVLALGAALIAYSRQTLEDRTAADIANDTYYLGFGVYVCDRWVALPDTPVNVDLPDGAKLVSGSPGVVEWQPQVLSGQRRAKLSAVLDLYSGVGLLTAGLAADCGPQGQVDAVESDPDACSDARRNLHDLPWARIILSRVEDWPIPRADVIVLDPPRSGAGRRVVSGLVAARPRRIVYVSCDPATLARDLGWLIEAGMVVSSVRVLDLFPMTHHVEVIAVIEPR